MSRVNPAKDNEPNVEVNPADVINTLSLCYRECYKFATNADKKELCYCNRPEAKHSDKNESSPWSIEKNTRKCIDPRHGQLENNAWFVRLDITTSLEKVEKILLDAWRLPKPRFIVSIIGGAAYFKLDNRLEENFIDGMVDIATKTDAWLLTSGYKVGIVQLVGQAINKIRLTKPKQVINAIGISKWGSVKDVKNVTNPKKQSRRQQLTNDATNASHSEKSNKKREHGEQELELNHSHYLVLDDGTLRRYNTKDYRTRLACHLARLQHDDDVSVPVVTIVVEGGKDTVENIYYDLKSNIPVVIVDGSGRVADFFSRCLSYTQDVENKIENQNVVYGIDELVHTEHPSTLPPLKNTSQYQQDHCATNNNTQLSKLFENHEKQIKKHLETVLYPDERKFDSEKKEKTVARKKNKKLDGLVKKVLYCLQPSVRSDITLFDLSSDTDLAETIFRCICRSRQKLSKRKTNEQIDAMKPDQGESTPPQDQITENTHLRSHYALTRQEQKAERTKLLHLAMDWDCVDVAKEFIFQNSLDCILNQDEMFKKALEKNLPTFVYEFLNLRYDPTGAFRSKRDQESRDQTFLDTLYTLQAVNNAKTHLKYFIHTEDATHTKRIDSIETLNWALSEIIGDYMHPLYFNTSEEENNYRVTWGLMKKTRSDLETSHGYKFKEGQILEKQRKYDRIMRDLFLWAILMNYTDMAKIFLAHMKYRICPALIATKIFKEYYKKVIHSELKDSYKKSADYFEQYAIDCLDKCDDRDIDQACEIVLQQNELYGYVSCLQVAAYAKAERFIATPCCVQAMNNIWYDKLHPKQTRLRNKAGILTGFMTFGLAAPACVTYRKGNEEMYETQRQISKFRSHGINYCDPSVLEYPHAPGRDAAYTRYLPKLNKFHQSLTMKFWYHSIFYIFFLLLFSYVLLFNFSPPTNSIPSIHWTEILTIIFVNCMLIEEIHYYFRQDSLTFLGRLRNYFTGFKLMALVGFILFYIGLILRFRHANTEEDFSVARVVMAIALEIWWLRCLSFIIVFQYLGPHLVAISKMLRDLVFFMCLIAIVMAGYGVASRSMTYFPVVNDFTIQTGGVVDNSFDGRSVFREIAYPVYYFLYGNVDNELANLDTNPNAGWSIATQVLLAFHMIFVDILLTNLLIAMFSKRFEEVHEDTQNIWHSQQYRFTREYYTRSPFMPPISVIYDIYFLCRMFFFFVIRTCCHQSADRRAKTFQIIARKPITITEWCEFEESATYDYAHAEVRACKDGVQKTTREKTGKSTEKDIESANTLKSLGDVQDGLKALETMITKIKGELDADITRRKTDD